VNRANRQFKPPLRHSPVSGRGCSVSFADEAESVQSAAPDGSSIAPLEAPVHQDLIMQSANSDTTIARSARAVALLGESLGSIHQHTDRLFARLMVFQWLAGVAAALLIAPKTWVGMSSQVHWHVWGTIFLGGAISGLPVFLAWKQPGQVLTRHVIAVAQMLTSALLIHVTGGRIETHFHVFGSLAFLAFYRDWRVLITATVVVALDHMARGLFWPQSVFGVLAASPWRWLEHAGWVIFEDTFLIISIRQSLREMSEVAARRSRLEAVNAHIENQVTERTAELTATHKELVEASRQAGMAEMATGVLHNVGNVLNSINVASACVADSLKRSKASSLTKVVELLREHKTDLATFLTKDTKGKQLPGYLEKLADHLVSEQATALQELGELQKNIEHIRDIITMQQSCAKRFGTAETLKVAELVEDALRMNANALTRHEIHVTTEFDEGLTITVEKHRVLQILVNLVRNAKQACEASNRSEKKLMIRASNGDDRVRISVTDNGVGIAPEHLDRLFVHGFTTKKDGHGFGLHSGAQAAKEIGGALLAQSAGPGQGATFTLELPRQPREPVRV
jgi:signal transduction histidine kinase